MTAADLQHTREIEIKLVVQRRDVKRLRRHPLLASGFKQAGKAVRQESVYFDDRRRTLQKKGISLRVRSLGTQRVQTIKALNGHAGPIDRGEWQSDIVSSRPDLSAAKGTPLEPALAKLRDPLKPVFETRVLRTEFPLQFGESKIVLALDRGRIDTGDAAAPICELELELNKGRPDDLFRLARQLDGKIPLGLSYETKSERGYALLDASDTDIAKARAVSIQPGMSCADAFRTVAHECLRQMTQNREGVARGKAEALHQMRIAIRRFRSALTFFKDIVAGPGTGAVKQEFRRLRDLTGPARDLDLFVTGVVAPLRGELPRDRTVAAFHRHARGQRTKANIAVRKAILSSQFRKLMLETAGWVEGGDWRARADALTRARQDAPIEIYAAERLSALRRKLRKEGQSFQDLDDEQRHRLRVRAKKLRYAAEFFSGLASDRKARKRARRMVESLRALQDKLGALNDLAVHRALALDIGRDIASSAATRGEGLAVAELIASRQLHAKALTDEAATAFAEFRKSKSFWKWAPRPTAKAVKQDAADRDAAQATPEPAVQVA